MQEKLNIVKDDIFESKKKIEEMSTRTKQETLKSLEGVEDFDLYSINISELGESDVSMDGDIIQFKEGVEKKDEIGNYIIINGMKCRGYQPGISGFIYKNIKDRYHFKEWLEIGFCDNGQFKKSIIIEDSGHPMECKLIPNEVSRKLGGHLYEIEENPQVFIKIRQKGII